MGVPYTTKLCFKVDNMKKELNFYRIDSITNPFLGNLVFIYNHVNIFPVSTLCQSSGSMGCGEGG